MHPVRFASVAVFDASPQALVSHQGPTALKTAPKTYHEKASEGGNGLQGRAQAEANARVVHQAPAKETFGVLPLFRRRQDMPFSKPGVALLSLVAQRTS